MVRAGIDSASVDVKIEALEYLRTKRVTERNIAVCEIALIDAELRRLGVKSPGPLPIAVGTRVDSPLAMATALARELNRPLTTREITDHLIARGINTSAQRFVASMYATLRNSKAFVRRGGQWELAEAQQSV